MVCLAGHYLMLTQLLINRLVTSNRTGSDGRTRDESRYRRLTHYQIVCRLDTKSALPYGLAQGKWKSQVPAYSRRFPLWRDPMPLSLTTLSLVDSPVTLQEGLKILERDDHRCQYCGLDGRASFENALVMRVDFVVPRARKGKKDPSNLVACCTPCNTIKGTRVYAAMDESRAFVLARRVELRNAWESKTARPRAKSANA